MYVLLGTSLFMEDIAMSRLFVIDIETKIKYRLSQTKIKNLKKNLRADIAIGKLTLRQLATHPFFYDNKISFQTLGRFVNEKDYVPASYETCKELEILADPNPYRGLPKWYQRNDDALNFFNTKRAQIKKMSDDAKCTRINIVRDAK